MTDRWQDRFVRHAWWVALVIGVLVGLFFLLEVGALLTLQRAFENAIYSEPATIRAIGNVSILIGLLCLATSASCLLRAVRPLRRRRRNGWSLVYVATMLHALGVFVVPLLITIVIAFIPGHHEQITPLSVVVTAANSIIAISLYGAVLYILFHIRSRFTKP